MIFFYSSALIEQRGVEPLLKIHEELGGWPVVKGDAWDESAWNWVKSVQDFRQRGFSTDYIFDFSVGTDLKNSTRRIIDVSLHTLQANRLFISNFFSSFY